MKTKARVEIKRAYLGVQLFDVQSYYLYIIM